MKTDATLYETIVRDPATCRRLSESFYARAARDPVLRPFFPGKTQKCAIEEFTAFLTQFLGGPAEETQHRWWLSLRESHARFAIGPREREAWMRNMIEALDDAGISESARDALRRFFEESSAYVVNQGKAPGTHHTDQADSHGAAEDSSGDRSNEDSSDEEIARSWHAQRQLDEAVAAIRAGEPDRTIALVERPPLAPYCEQRPAVFAALLAAMINRGDRTLLDYVHRRVRENPALAREQYSHRTLLHEAAISADAALVDLLLSLGADPRAGVHTPLYRVGNECKTPGAASVIAALLRAGAEIDAQEGPKRCTALHMAARRDNVDVAAALLDHGANIEAKDSAGDTPLRRAVNCNQPEVAALLLSRGADPHSRGSKGLTPLLAARSAAMKRILQSVDSRNRQDGRRPFHLS